MASSNKMMTYLVFDFVDVPGNRCEQLLPTNTQRLEVHKITHSANMVHMLQAANIFPAYSTTSGVLSECGILIFWLQ